MAEELLLHTILTQASSENLQKIALQIRRENSWQTFTYSKFLACALKISNFLLKHDFKQGDFIAIILENCPEWPMIYLGIINAGMVCVPLDVQLTIEELKNILNDCKAEVIFTSLNIFQSKVAALKASLKKIIILDRESWQFEESNTISFSKIMELEDENITFPQVRPSDLASLIYTSGTTAQPKGVMLSHANLCANFRSIDRIKLCLPEDNFLSILPLHHTYAFMVTLAVPLSIGASVTYCASLKSEDLKTTIGERGVTILVGVPQIFSLLHKAIFAEINKIPVILRPWLKPLIIRKVRASLGQNLRLFVSGGARLNPKIARDLNWLGIKMVEGYGLTETSPVVTLNPPQKIKFGSVGRAVPDVEIKIVNTDKNGIGEVCIKGPNVMQGYFRHPELTAQVIKQGWFYSGDLGFLDQQGYLFLTGRAKDVIVLSSGKNIYPEELEELFISRSPYIKEICIFGKKEDRLGRDTESLFAVIVPDFEYFKKNNQINIREKIKWEIDNITKPLPSYQHIMGFTITKNELPRTQLRKIKRYLVKETYLTEIEESSSVKQTAISDEEKRFLETEVGGKVINYLSKELKRQVRLDNHLEIDLGIDSLSRVELGLGLERLLQVKIPPEVTEKVFTVKELIISLIDLTPRLSQKDYTQGRAEITSWKEVIRQALPRGIIDKIKLKNSFMDILFVFIFKIIFLLVLRIFWFLKIEGREFIPRNTPYILCPNHASYLDGFIVFSSLPIKSAQNLFFVGQAAIFGHPMISWAMRLARLISIDPAVYLTKAMQVSTYVLTHQKAICIFPEGSRSINAEVGDFKKGIGILARELDVPVIPVYIEGAHYAWPRTSKFPRPYPLKIVFGKPLTWRELGADYETIALRLREEVLKLKNRGQPAPA